MPFGSGKKSFIGQPPSLTLRPLRTFPSGMYASSLSILMNWNRDSPPPAHPIMLEQCQRLSDDGEAPAISSRRQPPTHIPVDTPVAVETPGDPALGLQALRDRLSTAVAEAHRYGLFLVGHLIPLGERIETVRAAGTLCDRYGWRLSDEFRKSKDAYHKAGLGQFFQSTIFSPTVLPR